MVLSSCRGRAQNRVSAGEYSETGAIKPHYTRITFIAADFVVSITATSSEYTWCPLIHLPTSVTSALSFDNTEHGIFRAARPQQIAAIGKSPKVDEAVSNVQLNR